MPQTPDPNSDFELDAPTVQALGEHFDATDPDTPIAMLEEGLRRIADAKAKMEKEK